MSACACVLLLAAGGSARAADYPLCVQYLPYSPPDLYLRTTRATTSFYVSITPGCLDNFVAVGIEAVVGEVCANVDQAEGHAAGSVLVRAPAENGGANRQKYDTHGRKPQELG